ncbi:MAG: nucleotidyltransferase family protein [Chloroflexota bacterium]
MSDTFVAGLILAAGRSQRFGSENKLRILVDGVPLVRRTAKAYLSGGLDPLIVVVGFERDEVSEVLGGLPVSLVINLDFDKGQSGSLRRGLLAVPESSHAVVAGVADQPLLSAGTISDLIKTYREGFPPLVVPRYGGRRGNPALFDRSLFPEMLRVTGDQGARPVIAAHRDEIEWLDVANPVEQVDIDTADDYRSMPRGTF